MGKTGKAKNCQTKCFIQYNDNTVMRNIIFSTDSANREGDVEGVKGPESRSPEIFENVCLYKFVLK